MNRKKADARPLSSDISGIFGIFLSPPPYHLPESIRKALRDLVEMQDIEWSLRHPHCTRRKEDFADEKFKWGDECLSCFSDVSAQKTIGDLEEAISVYLNVDSLEACDESFCSAVDICLQRLDEQKVALATLLVRGWEHLFTRREEIATVFSTMERLREILARFEATAEVDAGSDNIEGKRQKRLVWLLADILRRGGLSCFLVCAEGKVILSPGMEILSLCLPLAAIDATPESIEQTLLSFNLAGEVAVCPK